MPARAIWKGELKLGKHNVGVKFYSAIEDRSVHFHLLHEKDKAPVEQHIVRKDTGEDVPKEEMRKAFAVGPNTAVILQPDELEELVPPESRDIELLRFVPTDALGDQWYERPYYLGPDGQTDDYFAFAEAMARKELIGIARWVMRKKRYLGALRAEGDYLQSLVEALKGDFKGVILLAGAADGNVSLVAAVSPDLTKQIQAGKIIQTIAPMIGGRGGGRPEFARGAGKDGSQLEAALREAESMIVNL